jgi:putative membrane protein
VELDRLSVGKWVILMMRYGYAFQPENSFFFGHLVGSVIVVVIVSLVIVLGVDLINRGFVGDRFNPEDPENPLIVLKRRYAKGDITKREFEEIKKDIE